MKRLAVTALVAAFLATSASPSFARHYQRRVVRERVVVYRPVVVGPRYVVHRTVRHVHHRARHLNARFIPLPVPRRVPVPPPFRHF
jgi:hypothetical protein